jgi:hypothetical protein
VSERRLTDEQIEESIRWARHDSEFEFVLDMAIELKERRLSDSQRGQGLTEEEESDLRWWRGLFMSSYVADALSEHETNTPEERAHMKRGARAIAALDKLLAGAK